MKRSNKIRSLAILLCIFLLISSCISVSSLSISEPKKVYNITDDKTVKKENIDNDLLVVDIFFNAPEIKQTIIGGITYHELIIPDTLPYGIPGEPILPVKKTQILLPSGTEVKSITVIPAEKHTFGSGYVLVPEPEHTLDSSDEPNTRPIPKKELYSSLQQYPQECYTLVGTQWYRGIASVIIGTFPIVYIPGTGTVSYYSQMTIKIQLQNTGIKNPLLRGSPEDLDAVSKNVENPGTADTYRTVTPENTRKAKMLIITTEDMKQGYVPLAQAHTLRGTRTIIKTLETDIPLGQNTNQTCENIRNYIRDAYRRLGIEYVLLGGDMDKVPAPYLMGSIPSDFFYGCLDGSDNNNGDRYWGQNNDGTNGGEVDLVAEVSIGRACTGNLSEVGHFVNKTLWYLRGDTASENYWKTVLLAGEHLFPTQPPIWGEDELEQLIDKSTRDGYTTVGIPSEDYSIQKLYDSEWQQHNWSEPNMGGGGWPKQLVIDAINNGTYIIAHLGHSGPAHNMKLDIYWRLDDFLQLRNTQYCFIFSQGCSAGAFDQNASNSFPGHEFVIEDCIAEYLTVKNEFGAFAGIWNSVDSYHHDSTHFSRWFWDGVYRQGITTISTANQFSKEQNILSIHTDGGYRNQCYKQNYFGDPALAFRIPRLSLHAVSEGPSYGFIETPIRFNGSAFGGVPPYSYEWHFDDGTTSKQQNFSKIYRTSGNYSVTLTVFDGNGHYDTDVTYISVADTLIANPHGPYNSIAGFFVQMNGSATGGFPPYTWLWNFGDGTWDWEQETLQNPLHQYYQSGRYNVTLQVTDRFGNFHIKNTTAIVSGPPQYVRVDDNFNSSIEGWGIDHFNNIQDAIAAVEDYGTVSVAPGTYGVIWVGKPVSIIGDDATQTFIDGFQYNQYSYACVYIGGQDIIISGFTIRNCSQSSVMISYASHIKIAGNVLEGVSLQQSSYITIRDNTFLTGGIINTGEEQYLSHWNTHTIENNLLQEKRIYYYKNSTEPIVVPSDAGQVILANCSHVTMDSLTLEGGWNSIQLGYSSNNTITRNSIATAQCGYFFLQDAIVLLHSSYNTIENNMIFDSQTGINIRSESRNNTIAGNTIQNCYGNGIMATFSTGNRIKKNTISLNVIGISFSGCSENIISENTIRENFYGLYLDRSATNTIYHNNFIDNSMGNAVYSCVNMWNLDYPNGGNYWSDYIAQYPNPEDQNGDGFWDDPYRVDELGLNYDYQPYVNENGWR